ncbi:MAG: hypothetical protein ACM3OO_03530 [Planctomycetaceae bacterium]
MRDLRERLREVDRVEPPDVWARAVRQGPTMPPEPERRRPAARVGAVLVALAVTVAATALLLHAFRQAPRPAGLVLPPNAIVARVGTELVAVSADGSGQAVVMTDAASRGRGWAADEPAWSPDGSRLAFVMDRRTHLRRWAGDGYLFVMNADASGLTQLTTQDNVAGPTWSPDGSQIAYVRNQGQQLMVMNADGSDAHVIASVRGYYQRPAWSANGRWIAYQSRPRPGVSEAISVFEIRPDGTGEREIAPAGQPAWSPDGRLVVAFWRGPAALTVMMADGTAAHRVTRCRLPCVDDLVGSWSPDGRAIAFLREANNHFILQAIDLETGAVRRLLPGQDQVGVPAWRPEPPSAIPSDPCALLTPAQIAAATNGGVMSYTIATDAMLKTPSTDVPNPCVYRTDTDLGAVVVQTYPGSTQVFATERDRDPRNTVSVDGFGDEAFVTGKGSLWVRIGGGSFSIGIQHGGTDRSVAVLEALATQASHEGP